MAYDMACDLVCDMCDDLLGSWDIMGMSKAMLTRCMRYDLNALSALSAFVSCVHGTGSWMVPWSMYIQIYITCEKEEYRRERREDGVPKPLSIACCLHVSTLSTLSTLSTFDI